MSIPAYLKPENGPLGRAFTSWLDHAPQGLAGRFVLLWFVILYTAFAAISSAAAGLPPDMLETYARGLHPAVGHAPLAALMAGAWFRLFPPAEWAFHLLAMVNAAAGLFAADRIARRHLTGDKPIAALLLLLLTPFYPFAGQDFGAAATMLSTWPIATWCFLRAFATRAPGWSAAAGAATALAVLGHHASVFLVAGFMAAVLAHPGRWAFLRSGAPWLMAAMGAVVLTPHLRWLYENGLASFVDAPSQPAGAENAPWNGLAAAAAGIAAVSIVLAVWWLAVRPGRAAVRDTLWPPEPDGRMLVILLAAPLALTIVAAPLAGAALTPPWPAASTWFLLPVVLLRPKDAALTRTAAIRITALAAAAAVCALAAAPLLAWRQHTEGTPDGRAYYRPVSAEATNAWRRATGQPLRVVMGDPGLAAAVTFYSADRPDAIPGFETGAATPPVTPERLARDGFAALCRAGDETCVNAARQQAAGKANVQFITYSTMNRYLGKPGRLERFFFILAPPESKPATMPR
jgi:hypothetical protein